MIAVIDNGHGRETAGKRSPVWADGAQLFEWEFNRDVARRICAGMHAKNKKCILLVPEDTDVPLRERVNRANLLHKNSPGGIVLFSVHANAGGGTGWEVHTSKGTTRSDKYATILHGEAAKAFPQERMRGDFSDGDPDWDSNFQILRETQCPAVLSENFFMDTERDCRLIMKDAERQKIANFHVEALLRIGCE